MSRGGANWVFTLNNPFENGVVGVLPADGTEPKEWPDVKYCVYQYEEGEKGTPHWQGYVCFTSQKRLSWVQKFCSGRAHWERRRGSHKQAKDYCTKSESRLAGPIEFGVEPAQGKRSDLAALKEAVDAGASLLDMCESHWGSMSRSYRFVSFYRCLKMQGGRDWPTVTKVFWGLPGVGKSRRAHFEYPGAYWLPKPASKLGTAWFDGYDAQEVVVVDEFYGWLQRDFMCRMCDRYPFHVQTKGGQVPFLAKVVVVTSNCHPDEWWPNCGIGAMQRRLEGELGSIEEMVDVWLPPDEVASSVGECDCDRGLSCAETLSAIKVWPREESVLDLFDAGKTMLSEDNVVAMVREHEREDNESVHPFTVQWQRSRCASMERERNNEMFGGGLH